MFFRRVLLRHLIRPGGYIALADSSHDLDQVNRLLTAIRTTQSIPIPREKEETMISEQERMAHAATFSTWVKALEADDVSGCLDCFASEVECEDIALQAKATGKDEFRKGVVKWLAVLRHERVQLDLQLEGDDHTAVMWTITVVIRDQIPGVPDRVKIGGRAIIHGVSVFRFDENSKFTWERIHWDLGELLRQIRD